MEVMRVSLAALMLASVTYCSHLDQYEPQHEDGPLPAQRHRYGGSTEHPAAGISQQGAGGVQWSRQSNAVVQELQVGSAHDLFAVKGGEAGKRRWKRSVEESRRKRQGYYNEWHAQVMQHQPSSQGFTIWQPADYQISRPYYIPVWGAAGRLPVYYPPQPIFINNPYQPVPPKKGYLPPRGYLPPDPRTSTVGHETDESPVTVPSIINRNNDDGPVWDVDPPAASQAPPARTTTRSPGIPTRRTRPPGLRTTTFPPLVHRTDNSSSSGGGFAGNDRPVALRPIEDLPSALAPPIVTNQQPQTTQRPSNAQPSRCVWAIISCCTTSSREISYNCFERLGCTGAFWDASPCDSEFARAAIDVASKYYGGRK